MNNEKSEETEKFECYKCGCYFWVKDRNNFECPNCKNKTYDELEME